MCPALGAAAFTWQEEERAVNAVCQVVFWPNLTKKKKKNNNKTSLALH